MILHIHGHALYAYTGGKAFDPSLPTAILIHGVLCDHSVWALQSRYLANHGWNVLAIDLPGHNRSTGEAPETVEQAAQTIVDLMETLSLSQVALIGHSWGSLIALEAASQLKERASHLVLIGTAYPMKVSSALLDAALSAPEKAMNMVQNFSRNTLAPPSGAGFWVHGAGLALGRRLLRANPVHNVFHRGFMACDRYAGGETAIAALTCPVLFVVGKDDQMTSPKAVQILIKGARSAGKNVQVVEVASGHNQMSEAPEATLDAIYGFLQSTPLPALASTESKS